MSDVLFGGGNSSIQLARTSKGEYTYEAKLYFLGNDMRVIKKILTNILKTRKILEHALGQAVVPTDEMSAYLKSLEGQVEKAVKTTVVKETETTSGEGTP